MALNQSSTAAVFFHWFSAVLRLMLLLMLSSIFLLTMPSSLFAGLISRHVGLLAKFSLWSLRVMKACRGAMHSVRSSILSSAAIDLASRSIDVSVVLSAFL